MLLVTFWDTPLRESSGMFCFIPTLCQRPFHKSFCSGCLIGEQRRDVCMCVLACMCAYNACNNAPCSLGQVKVGWVRESWYGMHSVCTHCITGKFHGRISLRNSRMDCDLWNYSRWSLCINPLLIQWVVTIDEIGMLMASNYTDLTDFQSTLRQLKKIRLLTTFVSPGAVLGSPPIFGPSSWKLLYLWPQSTLKLRSSF